MKRLNMSKGDTATLDYYVSMYPYILADITHIIVGGNGMWVFRSSSGDIFSCWSLLDLCSEASLTPAVNKNNPTDIAYIKRFMQPKLPRNYKGQANAT